MIEQQYIYSKNEMINMLDASYKRTSKSIQFEKSYQVFKSHFIDNINNIDRMKRVISLNNRYSNDVPIANTLDLIWLFTGALIRYVAEGINQKEENNDEKSNEELDEETLEANLFFYQLQGYLFAPLIRVDPTIERIHEILKSGKRNGLN